MGFTKVLVANRGEIAVRLIRALREGGIASIAVYSDADRGSLHVGMADEAVHLGGSASSESYLSIEKVVAAARKYGAQAIHPGYGFLSENADFAEACLLGGLTFIGPPASAIRKMGSKTEARKLAIAAGAPVVPGTEKPLQSVAEAKAAARLLGFPVLLKAAAGGGGKGMRRVDREGDLEAALRDASSEAARAFNSDEVYVEKYVVEPRHVEIQILGDAHGNMIHLGERECSIQRRHQKVIEESPSPLMRDDPGLRDRMGEAALKIARAAGYLNAGTMEFLVDAEHSFYFLEMNTRLQVEHPVTEMVTGVDLVDWQLRIAAGEPLTLRQQDIHWQGSAIECRIYAEDPDQNFLPFPGKIQHLVEPSGPGIRVDSGVYVGWTVPMEYDPLLAKLVAWAPDRERAIARMDRALSEYRLTGIRHNVDFFRQILATERFREGSLSTGFLDGWKGQASATDLETDAAAALIAAVQSQAQSPATPKPESSWRQAGREAGLI